MNKVTKQVQIAVDRKTKLCTKKGYLCLDTAVDQIRIDESTLA